MGIVLGTEVKTEKWMEKLGPKVWSRCFVIGSENCVMLQSMLSRQHCAKGSLKKSRLAISLSLKQSLWNCYASCIWSGARTGLWRSSLTISFARIKGSQQQSRLCLWEYFAMGTNYGTAADDDVALVNEVFRFVPTQIYDNSLYQITISTHLQSDEANLVNTTVNNESTPNTRWIQCCKRIRV